MFKPHYSITPAMLGAISEIAEIKTLVERSKVLPLNEAQLRRQALVRMAHTSTSIEGNRLAEFQVEKIMSGQAINADYKSIQEVRNYQKCLHELDLIISEKKQLSIELILHLHEILMDDLLEKEKRGHFRKGAIYIVDDLGEIGDNVRYQGPEAEKVPFLVQELLDWIEEAKKDELHPILIAGMFHVEFLSIHPFTDGNGRLTRLLTALILYQLGWDFKKIIVLEDFYNRKRDDYYDALNYVQGEKYHHGDDLTPWLEYFIAGVLVEARKVAEKIKLISFNSAPDTKEQVFLDKDELTIMDFVSTTGQITSSDVMEVLQIAKRTAQLKLSGLVEKRLIKVNGAGPSTFYTLAQ